MAAKLYQVCKYEKIKKDCGCVQNIWGHSWENDVASLRVFMATLRKKLEKNSDSVQYIQTHVGIGYRMIKVE